MPETNTLLVREFPSSPRQRIHAVAALEGKMVHKVLIALLGKALALEDKSTRGKRGKS